MGSVVSLDPTRKAVPVYAVPVHVFRMNPVRHEVKNHYRKMPITNGLAEIVVGYPDALPLLDTGW